MAGLCTNYEGTQGLPVGYKQVPPKSGSTRVWCVAWSKEVRRKRVTKRKMKKLWQKRMYKSWQKLTWGLAHKGCTSHGRRRIGRS